ncbi:hypothetical protein LAZ67_18002305 [Cordylochernes scorpioides]|uniref:Transposase n=1 Tax=Cordylochernes scorpioides TaxID=51811 RepID=A0ABY6LGT4_9ARAC|nr:hypothetical protein LAZ67_18002305 [Cordylochernes scorpioides]
MERSLEQRYALKFCVRLGKNATETFQILQKAFKDDCISRSQSGKWHKAFKEGREEVADEPRSGRPTTARTDENVDRVLEVLRTDRRLSIQQIADTLHMSTFVVHGIVTEDLQMRKVCAKLVPKVLTQDQKELRVLRCQELLNLIQNEPDFLNSLVTGDESWMFEYDPESKRQSCACHTKSSPRPKKARMSKSSIKTMIIVFFDIRGIVHCKFVPQGQTVNLAFYLEVLRRLKRRIAPVRTDIKDTVKLYHDNATSHTAFIITNFLARSNTPVILHPPYSPDLAPCDFFLFPRLKREMKGKHWETVENIQHHVTTFLRSIPVEEFQGAFQAWQTRLRKCIDAGGIVNVNRSPLKRRRYASWQEITLRCRRKGKKKLGEHLDVPENFAYSSGWLQRFKGRFHISQQRLCGEGASISPAIIDEHLKILNSMLANSGYDPANIYNAEETGLFFQLIPDRTLAHKEENCRGVKRMKQRITVLLCCNSTGTDKQRLLIIRKSAKPQCFRNFSPHFYCTYTSNSKAWMTSSIFEEWLLQFNKQLVSKGRRILLLLDNAMSHCVPNDGLSNIKIHFLPPNMTASL